MQTHLSHMQFNVEPANIPFYRNLLGFLGWTAIHEAEGMLGMAGPRDLSLWFVGQVKAVAYDYDGPGLNHLALGTATQGDVDAAGAFLTEQGVALLFETPRHRPDFSMSEAETYYQIMFETPDRILVEVVYTGLKEV